MYIKIEMKKMIFLLFILILFYLFYYFYKNNFINELFNNFETKFEVVHMSGNDQRLLRFGFQTPP